MKTLWAVRTIFCVARRSRQDTRQALIHVALDQIQRERLHVGIQHIKLPVVGELLGMSAGSAYYAFPEGQDEFQAELVEHLARHLTLGSVEAELRTVRAILEVGAPIDELVRVVDAGSDTTWFSMFLSLCAAVKSDERSDLSRILVEVMRQRHIEFRVALDSMLVAFDRQTRPPFTVDDLSMMLGSLSYGLRLRRITQRDQAERVVLRQNDAGLIRPWSVYACAVHALLKGFTQASRVNPDEPDDELIARSARLSLVAVEAAADIDTAQQALAIARRRLTSLGDFSNLV